MDQEPVFPQGRTSATNTAGVENAVNYLKAAATALRTSATYSLSTLPQSRDLLVLARWVETGAANVEAVLDELKQG